MIYFCKYINRACGIEEVCHTSILMRDRKQFGAYMPVIWQMRSSATPLLELSWLQSLQSSFPCKFLTPAWKACRPLDVLMPWKLLQQSGLDQTGRSFRPIVMDHIYSWCTAIISINFYINTSRNSQVSNLHFFIPNLHDKWDRRIQPQCFMDYHV